MQDRVALFPGRVKLVPVAGQENTYDMVRADSPTQEGTPLSKENLLKDATAALYGLADTAVPDDVLVSIKTLIDAVNGIASSKAKIVTGSYTGDGTLNYTKTLTLGIKPSFFVIMKTGASYYYSPHNGYVFWINPVGTIYPSYDGNGSPTLSITQNDNGITIKNTTSTSNDNVHRYAYNVSGTVYYYFAIGQEVA